MTSQRQQRMPISCENCRKRKIRCSGDSTPCQTCVRRGTAPTCRYLRNQPGRAVSENYDSSAIARIEVLENLLKENITLTQKMLSGESSQRASSSPVSSADFRVANMQNMETTDAPSPSGRLVYSSSGHVRYVTNGAGAELFQDYTVSELPFSDRNIATHQDLLDLLPPLSRCDELKNVFMEVFSPLFHILHDPTFEEQYATFRQRPHETSLAFLALVFVILAIGVTALDDNHPLLADLGRQASPGENARSIACRFRNAAMRSLTSDHFLWRHNIRTLQALILLIYALSHAHGPAWSLLGSTLNIAIAIGCHVDPSRYDVTKIEGEERRRCWAALLMLYTIQETCLGIQAPIHIKADIQLPADIDDEYLSVSSPVAGNGDADTRTPSKMAYILHKFKLYQLAAEICSLGASRSQDSATIHRLDETIAIQATEQKQRFGHLKELPVYHQAHYYILDSYTNHLYLILHSGILSPSNTSNTTADQEVIERLRTASFSILDNYSTLRATPEFQQYRWYTDGLGSFHAFLASTTLAAVYSNDKNALFDDQPVRHVLDRLRSCLGHFRAAAHRSNICARAADVLVRLLGPMISAPVQPQANSPYNSSMSIQTDDSVGAYLGRSNSTALSNHTLSASSINGSTPSQEHPRLLTTDSEHMYAMPTAQVHVASATDIDLDGWTASAELQSFFSQVPNQQWLSPSVFPWWKWNDNDQDQYLRNMPPPTMDYHRMMLL